MDARATGQVPMTEGHGLKIPRSDPILRSPDRPSSDKMASSDLGAEVWGPKPCRMQKESGGYLKGPPRSRVSKVPV